MVDKTAWNSKHSSDRTLIRLNWTFERPTIEFPSNIVSESKLFLDIGCGGGSSLNNIGPESLCKSWRIEGI